MRHRNSGRKLNRNSAHRTALFRNLSAALIREELIKTTLPKAKELRGIVERLVTLAKNDSVAHRRTVFNRLRNKEMVAKLFAEIGPRFKSRPGGYVRVLKAGFRRDDNAPMAIIEFVDRPVEDTE